MVVGPGIEGAEDPGDSGAREEEHQPYADPVEEAVEIQGLRLCVPGPARQCSRRNSASKPMIVFYKAGTRPEEICVLVFFCFWCCWESENEWDISVS